MIRTVGFEAENLIVVTDSIDKFIEDTTKQHGSTFRLIDIKFAAAAKSLDSAQKTNVNYSALIIYEV